MDSIYVKTFLAFIIGLYGIYLLYASIKRFLVCSKARTEYVNDNTRNPNKVKKMPIPTIALCVFMVLLGVFGIVVSAQGSNDALTFVAYVFLITYAISLGFEGTYKNTIYFDDDGFFYEDTFYRFRNVNGIDFVEGFRKRSEVRLTTTSDKLPLPYNFALTLKEELLQYRKKRKIKKR